MSEIRSDVGPERFSVRYDGPALEGNTMDVRQLAPSLLALADLFVVAHAELGPTLTPPPGVEVTAQRQGSFIVDLWLTADNNIVDLLTHDRATAATNAIGLSGPVIGAIAWLVHRRRKGRESSVEPIGAGLLRITWSDGTTFVAPIGAQALAERMDFNRTAGRVFEPLRDDGVDTIELNTTRLGRGVSARVQRDDLRAFNPAPESDALLSDNTRTITVRIETLPLKMGNKWRVHDGLASMWASLDDIAYAQQMESGFERFGVDDRMVVLMRDRQLRSGSGDGISWEHSIQKVIEHKSVPPPDELPFGE